MQLLKSGEESHAFTTKIAFHSEEDRLSFEKSPTLWVGANAEVQASLLEAEVDRESGAHS
ncbi:MAG TPA: hypothetical protein VGE57_09010 [Solimonas sp.]